jgi:thioredoxin-related protein
MPDLNRLIAVTAIVLSMLSRPSLSAELIMFESASCGWCRQWHAEVGPGYSNSAEGRHAPLLKHRLGESTKGIVLRTPVVSTPTFVLVDGGKEIGRITGYPGDHFFYGMLDELLDRLPDWKRGDKSGT